MSTLTGCEAKVRVASTPSGDEVQIARMLYRVDDTTKGVSCYRYKSYGISCVRTAPVVRVPR